MKVSLVQPENYDEYDKKTRLSYIKKLLDGICETDLIILPELWGTGFFSFEKYHSFSENALDGETAAMMSDIAAEKKSYIFTGTFVEKLNGKYYNTALLMDKKGNIISCYRKIHLFGKEKNYLSRGNDISTVETDIGIVGMSICYDLRFPELYRKMSEKGVQIYIHASAWPLERKNHLELLSCARAVENQALLFSCCMAGKNNSVQYSGSSMAVSPLGEILYRAGQEECIYTMDTDIKCVEDYRCEFSALKDRILY